MPTAAATLPIPALHLRVGRRVKTAREALNWSQEDLTHALGWRDRQSVSDVERGQRRLPPDELVHVAALLMQEVDFFTDPLVAAGEATCIWYLPPTVTERERERLTQQVTDWVGLGRWLNLESWAPSVLNIRLRLTRSSTREDAVRAGAAVARILSWATTTDSELARHIERHLGLPVLFVDLADPNDEMAHGSSGRSVVCRLPERDVLLVGRSPSAAARRRAMAQGLFLALTVDTLSAFGRQGELRTSTGRPTQSEALRHAFVEALLTEDYPTVTAPADSAAPARFSPDLVHTLARALATGRLSVRRAARALGLSPADLKTLFADHHLDVAFEL